MGLLPGLHFPQMFLSIFMSLVPLEGEGCARRGMEGCSEFRKQTFAHTLFSSGQQGLLLQASLSPLPLRQVPPGHSECVVALKPLLQTLKCWTNRCVATMPGRSLFLNVFFLEFQFNPERCALSTNACFLCTQ